MDINVPVSNEVTALCQLMKNYGSDKGGPYGVSRCGHKLPRHVYTTYYYPLFQPIRHSKLRVFELGIGSTGNFPYNMGKNGTPGASLRGWKEFFMNSEIFGGDIDRDILFKEDRIKTFYVDQGISDSIRQLWSSPDLIEPFDIIIDDGCHEFDFNVRFFENSFHKLKSGGVFIIEDICFITSKWHEKIEQWRQEYSITDVRYFSIKNANYDDDVLVVIQR
jgi:hypothetical protein